MLLNNNLDPRDRSSCLLSYEEQEQWLQAVWSGYVDPLEARRGAEAHLRHAAQFRCPLLLNDNTQLRGPWFNSFEWLAEVWLPQAAHLGLRYVAHIVQADTHHDLFTNSPPHHLPFELQIFYDGDDARQWLREQRTTLQAKPKPSQPVPHAEG